MESRLKVFVGPSGDPELEGAVAAAGGEIVPAGEAEAIVWGSPDEGDLRTHLHPAVKWVQLYFAGVDDWIARGSLDGGRLWTSAKGVYGQNVAEHALALLLSGAADLATYCRATEWLHSEDAEPRRISDATVTIVGAGGIGQALIRLLAPFGANTLAVTRTGRPVAGVTASGGPEALPTFLRESDYVVLCLPLTSATMRLISHTELRTMKESGWLVNVGRGALVDTDALTEALDRGTIRAPHSTSQIPSPCPRHTHCGNRGA